MKTIINSLIAISIITLVGCADSTEKNDSDSTKREKVKNITKEQVYTAFNEWLKSNKSFNEVIKDTFNVILTDINQDGYLDGLVDFNGFVPENGNASWYMGYPYFENTNEGLKYVSTLNGEIKDFPRINRVEFVSNTDGNILLHASRYKDDDANCCPSIERDETYVLKDGNFVCEIRPNSDWAYLDLVCIGSSCFEGEDCIFEFKNDRGEILKFTWYLSWNSESGSTEREFLNKYEYDGETMGYPSLNGKQVRVYFENNSKNPGKCVSGAEEGLRCTRIQMLEIR